ncbi:MAG: hypothetical protein ABIY51_01800 [Ferruginibacter sp.]
MKKFYLSLLSAFQHISDTSLLYLFPKQHPGVLNLQRVVYITYPGGLY